jgi:hypothetical protein
MKLGGEEGILDFFVKLLKIQQMKLPQNSPQIWRFDIACLMIRALETTIHESYIKAQTKAKYTVQLFDLVRNTERVATHFKTNILCVCVWYI